MNRSFYINIKTPDTVKIPKGQNCNTLMTKSCLLDFRLTSLQHNEEHVKALVVYCSGLHPLYK